ncbi:TonB-dependent siderophore receptor [Paracoccus sp. p4-l81]|uniref:TonB-dependent siderophore receptor n=1 Tax=Paracoccus sp. p4-l81 TaxID=3342806 RepID=UPI0035B8F8E1
MPELTELSVSLRRTLLAGVSLLALTPAVAQEPATDAVTLKTIVLTATTDASVQAEGYVASQAQAATKSDTPIAETQQSVSVVTVDQIRDQGAASLGQALSYTAGVSGQPYGADPRFDDPVMRGFPSSAGQYVNGLRSLRTFGATGVETYGMQQIEVLKGPSSSLYGAGSPAGIVNQVQKRAQDADFGETGAGVDSNGGAEAYFDVNRAPTETLSWRVTGIGRHSVQSIDELTNDRGYLAGAMRWRPSDATTIDVMASHTKDGPSSPARVPYALTRLAGADRLSDFYAGEENLDDSDRRTTNLGIEIAHEFDNGWRLEQGFRAESFDWAYSSVYSSGLSADGSQVLRGYIDQNEDSRSVNLDTRLKGEVVTGAATHRLLFGLDIRQYDAETTTGFANATPLDWRDPAYGTMPRPTAFWYNSANDLSLRQIGIYAQDEIEMGNWRASVALRHDRASQWGTTYTNFAGSKVVDQTDSATSGRAGIGYQMAGGLMPYLSYSTSFDPQIGADVDGNVLKPTTGKQWELGVKYQPEGFDGTITAALYDLRQDNVTVRTKVNGVSGSRQVGEVKSQGLELEATGSLGAWDLRGGYAFNDTTQIGGPGDGKPLTDAPRHLVSLWASHRFDNGWQVGGGIRHVGAHDGYSYDYSQTYKVDAVTLVDLGVSYHKGPLSAQVNVTNLADKAYVANCNGFGCNYGEGRSLRAGVNWRW